MVRAAGIGALVVASLCAHPALADDASARPSADIVAARTVEVSPEVVHAALTDLATHRAIHPDDCLLDWVVDEPAAGVGAEFTVTYRASWMRLRLHGRIARSEAPWLVELEHDGPRGIPVRWLVEPVAEGSRVTLTAYVSPPPWPFRSLFFNRIRPTWTRCWERAVDRLAARVAADQPAER